MATTQQQNLALHVVLESCDGPENGIVRGRSSGRQVGLKAVAESFSVDPMNFASSTCSPWCPLAILLRPGTQPPNSSMSAPSRSPRSPCQPEEDQFTNSFQTLLSPGYKHSGGFPRQQVGLQDWTSPQQGSLDWSPGCPSKSWVAFCEIGMLWGS